MYDPFEDSFDLSKARDRELWQKVNQDTTRWREEFELFDPNDDDDEDDYLYHGGEPTTNRPERNRPLPKPDISHISDAIPESLRPAWSGRWLVDVMHDGKLKTIYAN